MFSTRRRFPASFAIYPFLLLFPFLGNVFLSQKGVINYMKTYKLVASALLAGLAVVFQLFNGVVGYPTGFGMTVDLVGLPILLAFFILGYDSALLVSVLLALVIALTAPTGYIGAVTKFTATIPMFLLPAALLLSMGKKLDAPKLFAGLFTILLILVGMFAVSAYSTDYAKGIAGKDSLLVGILPVAVIAISAYAFSRVWERYGKKASTSMLSKVHVAIPALFLAVVVRGALMAVTNLYFAGPIFFGMSPTDFIAFVDSVKLPFIGSVPWFAVIFFWNAVQGIAEFALAWIIAYRFGFAKRYAAQ